MFPIILNNFDKKLSGQFLKLRHALLHHVQIEVMQISVWITYTQSSPHLLYSSS